MGKKLLFILLFVFTRGHSQETNLAFKNITIDQGLSQNSVVDVAQDSLGFMWFATQDGLNRYDGQNFKIFPEVFDDVTSPVYSRLGKLFIFGNELWFISKGGKLKVMDLTSEYIYPVEKIGLEGKDLPPVSAIHLDEHENVWIGTVSDGVYFWNRKEDVVNRISRNDEFPFSLAGNEVNSLYEDNAANIWVVTNNGLTKINDNKTENHLRGVNANVLTQDKAGRLWLGTFGKSLFIKDKASEEFRPFEVEGFPRDLVVEAIHADSNDNIWIGTYGNGLFHINRKSGQISHLLPERRNPFSLGFQDVLSIKEDKDGSLWIGTDGGGVSYYNPHFHSFKSVTDQEVPQNISIEQIRAITTDGDGGVWIGTSGKGFTHFTPDFKKVKTYHLKPYRPEISNYDRVVSLMADEQGDLWIGTHGNGLVVKDRKTAKNKVWFFSEAEKKTSRIPSNTIWALLKAEPNRVFAATRDSGLLLIDKEQGVVRTYPESRELESSPHKKNIRSLVRVNDSILALGSETGAIFLLNSNSGNFRQLAKEQMGNLLNNEYGIKSLYYSNGFLWAGTAGKGITVTHIASGKTSLISSEDGIPNGMIYGILPQDDKNLWMSSNKGLFRIGFEISSNKVEIKKIQSFTVGDGLQSNEFNTGAYHRASDGTLFFGGINGLNYFDPEDLPGNRDPGSVVLTQALVENEPLEGDTLITYKKKLQLPYSMNSVAFNYTVLDYLSPETMNYEYMLEGYDEHWIEAGHRQYTAYTNLPPGDYLFKVKPSKTIISNAEPAVLGISVATPFWLRWWFILLIFGLILGTIYAFYKYRINQLLEVQRVKNNISADLHDDIGSRLTSIQFLSALSRKKLWKREDTEDCLEGIDEEVQASAEALNEIVWNIKMDDESLEDIVAKMRRYAGEAFDSTGINYSVDIKADFQGKKMGMQKRREIFLIFKELLNNVRKHSEAKSVDIEITIKEAMFYLSVADDGKGFDPELDTGRNGLKNLRERISKWNGQINLTSQFNSGTKVEIWLPFDKFSFLRKVFGRLRKK